MDIKKPKKLTKERLKKMEEYGDFIPAPHVFVFDPSLSAIELRVLLMIIDPYIDNAPFSQSQACLAEELCISRFQIIRIMKALKEKGYVKETKHPGYTSDYVPEKLEDIYPSLKRKKEV